ncbi:MAG TPA: hypothetical protein VJT73_17780 [Polyangiaceae bacterium]|nr:hypothetical protein [Polyangiaceae bacterium]
MLLGAATLRVGFFGDDFAFITWLDSAEGKRTFDLYEFASGRPAETYELVRRGPFPWWTAPDLKVRFLRPLSSALLACDHALFGSHPLGYHLHSLLWYLGLLVAVGLLLRQTLTAPTWGLALLMYALSESHGEPVGWISSRHALIAATPALFGLVAQLSYREGAFRPGRWLAPLGVVIGLLGSESAVGPALYWIAYEAVGRRPEVRWIERARGVSVPGGLVLAYLAIYKLLGYGAANNSAYIEPLADPLRFARVVAMRVPALLAEQFTELPSGMAVAFPEAHPPWIGGIATCAVALVLRSVWSAIAPSDRRALAWLSLGAFGSLCASVGGLPGSRLLLTPGIGGYALVAASVVYGSSRASAAFAGGLWARRAYAALMLTLHLVLAPVLFLAGVDFLGQVGAKTIEIGASLDPILGGAGSTPAAPKHVYILSSSDPLGAFYAGSARQMRAPGTAATWCSMSMARATHRIERLDPHTLLISADRPLFGGFFDQVFRSTDAAFAVGDTFDLDDLRVTVRSTESEHPTAIALSFHEPIDDPKFLLLAWREGKLTQVVLPAEGDRLVIPWSAGPTGFF